MFSVLSKMTCIALKVYFIKCGHAFPLNQTRLGHCKCHVLQFSTILGFWYSEFEFSRWFCFPFRSEKQLLSS